MINLRCGAHVASLRSTHTRPQTGIHFILRLLDGLFKLRRKPHPVFNEIVPPIADLLPREARLISPQSETTSPSGNEDYNSRNSFSVSLACFSIARNVPDGISPECIAT
jgi:hypothetical protein